MVWLMWTGRSRILLSTRHHIRDCANKENATCYCPKCGAKLGQVKLSAFSESRSLDCTEQRAKEPFRDGMREILFPCTQPQFSEFQSDLAVGRSETLAKGDDECCGDTERCGDPERGREDEARIWKSAMHTKNSLKSIVFARSNIPDKAP